MVAFNQIPSNLRINFVSVEFDNSQAGQGPALLNYRALIISQMTSSGTATANTLHLITHEDQAGTLCGRDSMGYRQARKWFKNNKVTETWLLVLADNGAGAVAAGSLTFAGTATAKGTVHLYAGDTYIPVGVEIGDTAAEVATAVSAAAEDTDGIPIDTAPTGAVVAVNFTHKGEAGNSFPLTLNYQIGQELPAGITCTVVQPTGGTTNPSLTAGIAALGDEWFHIIQHPFTDATSLTALEAELASRFGPMRQIDGFMFTGASGSVSTLTTLGNTRNSPHSSIVAQPGAAIATPPWEFSAAVAANVAYYGAIDPARPFQTLPLVDCLMPTDRFTDTERNTLLHNGIATTIKDVSDVRIERVISTYKTNAAGAADESYLDATSLLTLMYFRFSFRNRIRSKYPRHKLAGNGKKVAAGQPIMTPLLGKAEAINWFKQMDEDLNLAENFPLFKQNLVVERNANVNQLDFLLPPDLMNQLIVTAAKIQFRL